MNGDDYGSSEFSRISGHNPMNDIITDIETRLSELDKERKAILDISVCPELHKMLETRQFDFSPTYYFPDSIAKLLSMATKNEQYYYFVTKLLTRWTQRNIDIRLLNKIFVEREFLHARIELITKEVIDEKVYSFCYENFVSKDLVVELSPEFNLIGDVIGKILGFAKKSKAPNFDDESKISS